MKSFIKPLPLTADLKQIARRVIWFEEPAQALEDPVRFLAYAMRYASFSDMKRLRRYVSDRDFVRALDHMPPGIVDARSWSYWNAVFGRYPAPKVSARFHEMTPIHAGRS
jgi:hypothetical protein